MTNRKEQKYESGVPHFTRQSELNSVMTLWDKIDISPKEIQRQFVADKDKDWMPDFIADIFCGEDSLVSTFMVNVPEGFEPNGSLVIVSCR